MGGGGGRDLCSMQPAIPRSEQMLWTVNVVLPLWLIDIATGGVLFFFFFCFAFASLCY